MEKFFVLRVKYLNNGTIKKSEIMEYETERQAFAKYHSNLGTDMNDESLSGAMCTIINQYGVQIAADYFGYITDTTSE